MIWAELVSPGRTVTLAASCGRDVVAQRPDRAPAGRGPFKVTVPLSAPPPRWKILRVKTSAVG